MRITQKCVVFGQKWWIETILRRIGCFLWEEKKLPGKMRALYSAQRRQSEERPNVDFLTSQKELVACTIVKTKLPV